MRRLGIVAAPRTVCAVRQRSSPVLFTEVRATNRPSLPLRYAPAEHQSTLLNHFIVGSSPCGDLLLWWCTLVLWTNHEIDFCLYCGLWHRLRILLLLMLTDIIIGATREAQIDMAKPWRALVRTLPERALPKNLDGRSGVGISSTGVVSGVSVTTLS